MPTAHVDIIEAASVREENGIPVEVQRLVIVSGLTPIDLEAEPPLNEPSLQFSIAAAVSGVPDPGDAHPSPALSSLEVTRRDFRMRGPTIVEILVTYSDPDGDLQVEPPPGETYVTSGGSSLEQSEEITDINGNPVEVSFGTETQRGRIPILRPRSQVRLELLGNSDAPGAIGRFWTGAVNAGSFPGIEVAAPPATWLVESVDFQYVDSDDATPRWRFSWIFRNNPDGFDPFVFFVDPDTGRPPPGLVVGTGIKRPQAYPRLDFTTLPI